MASNPSNLIPIAPRVWKPAFMSRKREALWLQNPHCHWCGELTRLINDNAWDKATRDHVIPRYKGGTDDPANVVLSCNRCNNRRCHEDTRGLPDGSLLGKYKVNAIDAEKRKAARRVDLSRIALTGDEKKAIMAGTGVVGSKKTEDVLREQRDQGLIRITNLTEENRLLEKELKHYRIVVVEQEDQLKALKSMTLWMFIKKRLAAWLLS